MNTIAGIARVLSARGQLTAWARSPGGFTERNHGMYADLSPACQVCGKHVWSRGREQREGRVYMKHRVRVNGQLVTKYCYIYDKGGPR